MKVQLEHIKATGQSSFQLMHNPKLSDLFFWHFHPEYELVYIEAAAGKRHVGEHIGPFTGNDLVLIGSYVPHLNFDYGIKTDYLKEVLHLNVGFCTQVLPKMAEIPALPALFEASQKGIVFYGATKEKVGQLMKTLHTQAPFDQLLTVLKILMLLAASDTYAYLHPTPVLTDKIRHKQLRLQKVYAHISKNYQRKIEVAEVANLLNLTNEAFCRYFKKTAGTTFTNFLNQYRVTQAKRLLLSGKNISETFYESGFESLSYFTRVFKKVSGENPSDFRKRMRSTPPETVRQQPLPRQP